MSYRVFFHTATQQWVCQSSTGDHGGFFDTEAAAKQARTEWNATFPDRAATPNNQLQQRNSNHEY